ncbi:MAG TPA: BatA domain-containing protein [Spirochaetota bacterium]|nr:BatA domain-containing protein [Spirochaetota bacterium]
MIFLYPYFLYFLPLGLVPLIWHLINLRTRRTVIVPSNFFVQQLRRNQRRRFWVSDWLELMLEMLFIFMLIFLFSSPRTPAHVKSGGDIYVFIDNTASIYEKYNINAAEEYKQKVFALYNSLEQTQRLFLFNVNMVKNSSQPVMIENKKELNRFFQEQLIYNTGFQLKELKEYIDFNKALFYDPDTRLILLSDFSRELFQKKFYIKGKKIYLYDNHYRENYMVNVNSGFANKIFFINNNVPFKARLLHKGVYCENRISLFKGKDRVFIKSYAVSDDREINIDTSLKFKKPGLHIITMVIENEIRRTKYYYPVFISDQINIAFLHNRKPAYIPFFKALLQEDIKKGNISIKNKDIDFVISSGSPLPDNLRPGEGKKNIVFLYPDQDIKILNDTLNYKYGIPVRIKSSVDQARTFVKAEQYFDGVYSIFNRGKNLEHIYVKRYYRIQNRTGDTNMQTVVRLANNDPFFIKGRDFILFPFDPALDNCNLFLTGSAVSLILQIFLDMQWRQQLWPVSPARAAYQKGIYPAMQNYAEQYLFPYGVYTNRQQVFLCNPAAEKYLQDTFDDFASFFADYSLLSAAGFSMGTAPDGCFLSYNLFIFLVLLILLVLLLYIFIKKAKYAGY